MKTLEFIYQENILHFLVNPTDKNVMVNATEMAKMFDKRTAKYLKTDSTKSFIIALERAPFGARSEGDQPLNGGRSNPKMIDNRGHMGIYFNRKLALDFAAWLDVDFRVWIIDIIDELLFAKNKKVAQVFSNEHNLIEQQRKIIENAVESNNKELFDLLDIQLKLEKNKYQKRKALKDFTNQFEMDLK